MADYIRPTATTTKYSRTDSLVIDLTRDYGASAGQEAALLNGLLAMGYDPAIVRSFADADPNRRYLDDAITRALRAGVPRADIEKALRATRLAATGDPQGAIRELGVDPNNLPPDSRAVYDQIANRQPLPFLDRGQTQPAATIASGWSDMGRPVEQQRSGGGGPRPPVETRTPDTPAPPGQRAPGTVTQLPGAGTPAAAADTTPALGAGASEEAVRAYVRRHYSQYAWMLDVPDIANVMREAAEKGWASDEVWGAFIASPWYKKTEPDVRTWTEKKSIDPAGAKEAVGKQKTVLRNQALGLGINIPAADLDALAEDSLKFNWDDNELRAALGRYYEYDPKNLLGAAQATSNHLRQQAREWLVPIDDATLGKWTEQVIRGEATTDYFDTYLAQQARSLFPQLEEPISRGVAPSQWMAPYVSIAAQTLEMDPEKIDLRDTKWLRAINQVDEKGGRTPMTLYDWENLLKTDESYGYDKTRAGRDHGAALARSISKRFGFATS